jgi:hypothetical protein
MRRVFLMTVAAGLVIGGTAGPALAASHTHNRSSSTDAFAVWRSRTPLSHGQFKLTTWFIGVFQFSDRTSGQVIKDVVKCKRVNGHARCRRVSFSAGFKRLTATEFTIDRKRLRSAHLDAAFRLRTFVRGKRVHVSTVKVVADWTGVGKITRSGGIDTFRSGCLHFHDVFHGKNRAATATATVNKTALGSSTRASLSTNTDVFIEHRC